jgi:hypothetical protein
MGQFYLGDEKDVLRCQGSSAAGSTITITGTTFGGHIKAFTGIVHSIEDNAKRHPSQRWRVTVTDTEK